MTLRLNCIVELLRASCKAALRTPIGVKAIALPALERILRGGLPDIFERRSGLLPPRSDPMPLTSVMAGSRPMLRLRNEVAPFPLACGVIGAFKYPYEVEFSSCGTDPYLPVRRLELSMSEIK